jgi:ribonuclease HI
VTATASPIPELTAVQSAIQTAQERSPSGWVALQDRADWEVYTDGSAPIKNPGGAIGFSTVFLLDEGAAWEVFGGTPGRTSDPATSNNRAEISGVLTILEVLNSLSSESAQLPKSVTIVCDSKYVVNCAQGRWKKHKNKDLWRRFDQLICLARQKKVKLNYQWTRAHVGTEWNERADVLAKDGAFLAIGKEATSDFQKPEKSAKDVSTPPADCHYMLSLYSEMTGKKSAKGTYRLATPNRDRNHVEELFDVLTLDEAEYHLLIAGLKDLLETLASAGRDPADFRLLVDSSRDLMLKQIQGLYGVKSERLQPLHRNVIRFIRQFAGVQWQKSKKADLKDALKSWS